MCVCVCVCVCRRKTLWIPHDTPPSSPSLLPAAHTGGREALATDATTCWASGFVGAGVPMYFSPPISTIPTNIPYTKGEVGTITTCCNTYITPPPLHPSHQWMILHFIAPTLSKSLPLLSLTLSSQSGYLRRSVA